MEFTPTPPKGAVKVFFITGSLNRFTGTKLEIGCGDKKPLTRRKFVLFMRKVIAMAKQNKLKKISLNFKDIRSLAPKEWGVEEVGKVAGCAFVMADYEHTAYKTKPKEGFSFVEVVAVTNTPEQARGGGFWVGEQIAAAVNECRELSNTPGGDMTPKVLAAEAKKALKGTKTTVKVLGRKEIEKLGMGAVLGVGKGSTDEPQFIIVEYWGAPKSHKPLVLAGKGVTFDTGGQQVKPGDHMYEMHMDMSGGAAVIYAVALAARMKLKVNVVALVPAVENATGPNAMRPGDVLKSLSGKTIEIIHTDAEGRLILADAITYAKRYNPVLVVDVATLTGAALTAFGEQASAFMINDERKIMEIMNIAEESGDYMWPMPLWEEYDYIVKGRFADIPNLPTVGNTRYAGVIGGGKFLEVFAKELGCPWMHIDMAPKMTAAPDEFLAKGAAGAPVRFLYSLIKKYEVK